MRIDTLNFRVIKWCGLALKSVIARRLAVADGRKYWNRQTRRTYVRLVNKLFWSIPGSKPPGNGRRIYFLDLPSAVVVGESSVARGTEAVKLSVKLLSGLTLMALIAVAVVGLSRSASAAVDGKIYVTNVASSLTNQSPAPTGRTAASTVYGTYASASTSGTSARDIVADSDTFIVTVVDADLNTTTGVTANGAGGTGFAAGNLTAAGNQDQFILTDTNTSPIIGDVSSISVYDAGTTTAVVGVSVKSINFAGDGTNPAIITLGVDFGTGPAGAIDIAYSTSAENTTSVVVKSVVDTGVNNAGYTLTLTETGRDTGIFEGYVKVFERTNADPDGTNSTSSAKGGAATVAAIGGPVTITYTDATTAGTATNVKRTTSIALDTTAPLASISAPASGSETQNRLPNFTGNVSDAESGLDVSTFGLYIDQTDDAANGTIVITNSATTVAPTINGTIASIDTSGTSDGASTMSFSHTPSAAIPTAVGSNPDHIVDYQVRVADLAGNYGYSDADTSTSTVGRHGNKPHTVKIDQKIPAISSASSGVGLDTSVSPAIDKANVRDTIKVVFDGNVKESSVSPSDFKITLSGNGGVFVPANVVVNGANVYLDLDHTIPSDNTPTVALQGTIQDLAGNSTDAGSAVAADKLAPVITVTRSGGTGTGTGSEGADSLTNGNMVITVSSDENLQGPPAITVTDLVTNPVVGNVLNGTLGVAQGGNVWQLTVAKGNASVNRAVKVVATDSATNSVTAGDDTTKAFVVDLAVATATVLPANNGTTTQSNPFITADFSSDQSSLTVTSATLDKVDVTSSVVASADKKVFFFQPTTALSNGSHTYELKVKDAAGNTSTTTTTFTKNSRTDFVIELFAGWNAISVPSNPIDNAIGSVFSNAGVKQVVAYDATTPAQPWRIASKVDGSFSSQTNPGLDSIHAGHGYWVETGDFENQKVALHGPTGPGDARPGLTTIPTGNGWNFVGVVDQSRIQTQAADSGNTLNRPTSTGAANTITFSEYFTSINVGRAYTFDTVASEFRSADAAADTVKIGSGIWAFISPQENGKLPHIVP